VSGWDTPWDPAPPPPEQPPPAQNQNWPGGTATAIKSAEGRISITLKANDEHHAPWIVIEAGSAEEVERLLRDVMDRGLHTTTARASKAFIQANGISVRAGESSNSGASPRQPSPEQGEPLPPGVEPRNCRHGRMAFRTGTNRNGNPYKAFFCPTPKNTPDQCSPIFL
jgi:hypothetical protein